MKKGLIAVSLGLLVSTSAMANGYDPAIEDDLINICRQAALNEKTKMVRAVKDLFPGRAMIGRGMGVVARGLVCNGMTVANFSHAYGAKDTYDVLVRYSGGPKTRVEIKDIAANAKKLPELGSIRASLK